MASPADPLSRSGLRSTRPLLLLDFDGVICDSLNECFVVGRNAYARMTGDPLVIVAPEEAEADLLCFFKNHRWMVGPAQDYFLLFWYWFSGVTNLTRDDFLSGKRSLGKQSAQYGRLFFEERHRLCRRHHDVWLQLSPLYPGVADWLRSVKLESMVHIVTTKDEESVTEILNVHDLGELPLAGKKEFDVAGGKAEVIVRVLKQYEANPSNAFFLDDNPDYLRDAATVGVNCAWAAWGYLPSSLYTAMPEVYTCAHIREFWTFVCSRRKNQRSDALNPGHY